MKQMKNNRVEVCLRGKKRVVRKGSLIAIYCAVRNSILKSILNLIEKKRLTSTAIVALTVIGIAFVGILDVISGGVVSADIFFHSKPVTITLESGETAWGKTQELNPTLEAKNISKLVKRAKFIEANSVTPRDFSSLEAGEEVILFCNKKIANELGLTAK